MTHSKSNGSRRDFLRLAAGSGVLLGAGAVAGGTPVEGPGRRVLLDTDASRVRNVIFMVVDGMDHSAVMLADLVSRRRRGGPSAFTALRSDPGSVVGQCMTHARNSLVTDSAAAGSAFGIGEHIDNGAINFVDGREPVPILVRARAAGRATGLVTTARITHATPASMACNVPQRNLEGPIAEQLLDRRFDLLLGGGGRYFPEELLARHPDVEVVRTRDGLAPRPAGRVLGVFDDDHLRYELDRPATQPSLAEMTSFALDRLSQSPGGFLVQVEAGRVDHAGHANDAAGLVHDMLAFDDALRVAAAFADARGDTLLIVTADHGTGGAQLTRYGLPGEIGIDRVADARRSFEWIAGEIGGWRGAVENSTKTREVIEHAVGFDPGRDRVEWMLTMIRDRVRGDGFDEATSPVALLGSVLANGNAVGFTSVNHNADYVEVFARGPGSDRLPRLIDNIDLHTLMCERLGIPETA